jgi:hypothetical protein
MSKCNFSDRAKLGQWRGIIVGTGPAGTPRCGALARLFTFTYLTGPKLIPQCSLYLKTWTTLPFVELLYPDICYTLDFSQSFFALLQFANCGRYWNETDRTRLYPCLYFDEHHPSDAYSMSKMFPFKLPLPNPNASLLELCSNYIPQFHALMPK